MRARRAGSRAGGAGSAPPSRRSSTLEPAAGSVQRLAVLLGAGVAPASSWQYLSEQTRGPDAPFIGAVADSAGQGRPVSAAIIDALPMGIPAERQAWRSVAAAWQVATEAGAPLAPTLLDVAASLRSLAQVERDLHVALAAPVATARMVMALPVIGVLFGLALGFDTLGTLFGTAPGLVCLAMGVLLMLAARFWNRRLVRAARPSNLTPGLGLDLMAIAVSGGTSIARARVAVDAAVTACGVSLDGRSESLEEVLALSARAGVPASGLLRSEADEERRQAKSDGDRRAATLAVTLMLPLGVCVLPAFMLLGVAPLLISVVSSTVERF